MSVKKFSFDIFNENYHILSDSDEETVLMAVSKVDDLMRKISLKLESRDRTKVAVLTALSLAEEVAILEGLSKKEDQEISALAKEIEAELV